jgi:hypothetical protein
LEVLERTSELLFRLGLRRAGGGDPVDQDVTLGEADLLQGIVVR